MTQISFQTILGPSLVLYLLLDVGMRGDVLLWDEWTIAAIAMFCSLAPYFVRSWSEAEGARRTGALGVALGVMIVGMVRPSESTLLVVLARVVAEGTAAALLLHLAVRVPDRARLGVLSRLAEVFPQVLATVAIIAGGLSYLGPLAIWGDDPWLVPSRLHTSTASALLLALSLSALLRFLRRWWGSAPGELAANGWALMGLLPVCILLWGYIIYRGAFVMEAPEGWLRATAAVAFGVTTAGHVALVDPRRRIQSAAGLRTVAAWSVAVAVLAWLLWRYEERLVDTEYRWAALLPVMVIAVIVLRAALNQPLFFILAPFRGRLLRAVDEVRVTARPIDGFERLAADVLLPLRRAAKDQNARPLLYTVEPYFEFRLDRGGATMSRECELPPALLKHLAEHPHEIIVRTAVERMVVRRPALRPVGKAVVRMDALAVVPLAQQGDLEGALVLPRGRRRSALTLEEEHALHRLAEWLTPQVAAWTAHGRARAREGALVSERDRALAQSEHLQAERDLYQAQVRTMRSGRGSSRAAGAMIAYSPAMRRFLAALQRLSETAAPILLVAEGGIPVDRHARQAHEWSPNATGPLVVVDCTSVKPDNALVALLGTQAGDVERMGWLQSAGRGTLMLADFPALTRPAQRALAEALATREARLVEGGSPYAVNAQVLLSSRLGLGGLIAAEAIEADLAERLQPTELRIPPLRECLEDMESIVLLAVHRACRVYGREDIGVAPECLRLLMEHPWPGNLRELQHVIDRAVRTARGSRIEPEDLPSLGALSRPDESYAEMERRVLGAALASAGGNQSEAARRLGLKRATFVDKLRRLGLLNRSKSGGGTDTEDAA